MLARHEWVSPHEISQRPIRSLSDSNTRSDLYIAVTNPISGANYDWITLQWQAVQSLVDPERSAKLAGPVRQIAVASCPGPARAHQRNSVERLECPDEYSARKTFRARDGVDTPMHSVDEIHVRISRRPVE